MATCLAGSLMAPASAWAEDSSGPAPASPFGTQRSPFADEPSPFDRIPAVTDIADALPSVAGAPASTQPALLGSSERPSMRPPRARLPLRKGHYGSKVERLQTRLAWLGYEVDDSNVQRDAFGTSTKSAVKAFQAKNWLPATGKVNKRTWKLLKKHAEPVGVLPLRCTEVKQSLCIDKTSSTLRYVVKGKVKAVTDARFGQPGMETDEGVFAIKEKSFNHTSTMYGSWMPRAMFFNGDEAVHYSPDFAAYGYLHGSHGCVGIRDMELATRLFEKVDVGTRVYVYWS